MEDKFIHEGEKVVNCVGCDIEIFFKEKDGRKIAITLATGLSHVNTCKNPRSAKIGQRRGKNGMRFVKWKVK